MMRMLFTIILMSLFSGIASGDTGLLREVVRTEAVHVLVFTAPPSLRVGASEIVVVVNDSSTGVPVEGVEVLVEARMTNWDPQRPSMIFAGVDDDGLRMARKAVVDLPSEGAWELEILVAPPGEKALDLTLDVFVSPAMSGWLSYGFVLLLWLPCVLVFLARDRLLQFRAKPRVV